MELSRATVHYLNKVRGEDGNFPATLRLRPALLPVNEQIQNLIIRLRQLYNSKSGHGYGVFHQNLDVFPLSGWLDGYSAAEWDFLEFSHRAMDFMKHKIDAVALATGGYFLFAAYQENEESFLLVASLKNRPGFVFNDDLDLADQEHIDLDHLHEMARINLTSWAGGGERYLSFAKRRASGDEFTKYFREFIGCDEFTESRTLTNNLLHALQAFSAADEASPEVRSRRREIVFGYCEEKRAAGERISLVALSGRLNEDEPEGFLNYVNENQQFAVGDDFIPDRNVYKKLQRLAGSDKRLSISFEADLLGNQVVYDAEQGTLLISNIPPSLRQQLDAR